MRSTSLLHSVLRQATAMRPPLISVIGATGTGKSQLAVDLALAYNGEIINADAMQMYTGLPIITNKVTEEECRGVKHHLMDFLGPDQVFRVGKFVREATRTMDEIRGRGRMPIIVGGTHYYVQALLFPESILRDEDSPEEPVESAEELSRKYPILDADTVTLYETLKLVDPEIAARWHPNDRRKIRRSLEIYYSNAAQKTASEIYAAQRAAKEEAGTPSPYRNLIFWVHSEPEVLKTRLDRRVDKMLDGGLWEEVKEMERLANTMGAETVEDNAGLFQSIGFKEFKECLQLQISGPHDAEAMSTAKTTALDDMKAATRRYAKAQVRWVRVKFINALESAQKALPTEEASSLYLMDSTDVPTFGKNVTDNAVKITEDFLAGRSLPDPLSFSELAKENLSAQKWDMSQRPDLWVQKKCELCDIITTNQPEWDAHLKNNKHKKRVARARKRIEIDEFLKQRGLQRGSPREQKPQETSTILDALSGTEEYPLEETPLLGCFLNSGVKRKDIRRDEALQKEALAGTTIIQ